MAFPVLVVEDDPDSGEVLLEFLRDDGLEVEWARTGVEALALVARQSFSVAFIDLSLPDMDGEDVAREIRRRAPQTRLALVTGFSAEGVIEKAPGLADRIFVKPADPEELIAFVRSHPAGEAAWQ